jgi:NADH dehydrogenase [ubiquinone] 1 alpha subcomplex assembly factor 7
MRDILKVFKQFPETKDAFSIHLVEVSSAMRLIQADTLQSSGCTFLPHAWYDSIKDVPKKAITYHIAHEFFDALPVHQFQFTDNGWREVFVDIDKSTVHKSLRFVLAPGPTFSSSVYTRNLPQDGTLTKAEISPSLLVAGEEISQRIYNDGGSALIVDYGEDGLKELTLRAFKDHKPADLLSDLGCADLTADVDFSSLRRIADKEQVLSHGPITQNEFLHKMGIRQRLNVRVHHANTHKGCCDYL